MTCHDSFNSFMLIFIILNFSYETQNSSAINRFHSFGVNNPRLKIHTNEYFELAK